MVKMDREYISEKTAFDKGELFRDDDDIKRYFTVKNMEFMFPNENDLTQDDLDKMAKTVISKKWHTQKQFVVDHIEYLMNNEIYIRGTTDMGRERVDVDIVPIYFTDDDAIKVNVRTANKNFNMKIYLPVLTGRTKEGIEQEIWDRSMVALHGL